jgi:hypothetical protein
MTRSRTLTFRRRVGVVDDATTFDAAVHMLDAHTPAGNALIRGLLHSCEGSAPRLLRRHEHLDLVERECQEGQILEQPAPRGQGYGVASAIRLSWVLLG